MDEAISTVSAITGATPHVARHFLSLTDGDAEQAIQLFYDSPDLGSGITQESSSVPATHSQARQARDRQPADPPETIVIDSDSDGDVAVDTDADLDDNISGSRNANERSGAAAISSGYDTYEDDEAVARRMQEELYAGGDMAGDYEAQGVRAPLARTTETLVGPGSDWTADDMHAAVLQQMRARQQPRSRYGRPGLFNQQATSSSIWDESDPAAHRESLAAATGGASEASSKAAKLAELFRPPFELMTRLPWDDARQKGKDESKWIIVNVQDPSIFDCQSLNRDIWKHEGIKETIEENFIFMQYDKDDPRGSQYIQYYFPLRDSSAAYPHIAIVDPRTGEQVKIWSGPPIPKAMDFLMQLHEFLDRYSLNVSVRNPVAKRKPEQSIALDVDKLTEDQMLEIALQNSLGNGSVTGPKDHDPDDLTKSVSELGKGKGKEAEDEREYHGENDTNGYSSKQVTEASPLASISSTSPHVEPANDPTTTTRIQFRHATGRIIRRFNISDPVRRIYEWLKAEPIEGKAGMNFELKVMGRDLIEALDENIGRAGLSNGTVMVEYLED